MSNIVIVGSGVVGTATGKGFAHHGHNVTFVDVDARRVRTLRDEGYAAVGDVVLPADQSFVFLTLPTPNEGHRWNLEPFVQGTRRVAEAIRDSNGFHTVVVRSTVPPGTADEVVAPILEEVTGGRRAERFGLGSNPEFLRAASALEDFLHPWMTVIASRSKRTLERLEELFLPFGAEIQRFTDPRAAEFVKAAHNLFNATKISFWNEMWRVGTALDIDVGEVARTVAMSAEASYSPEYGIQPGSPYGGACLPKDTKGFLGFARDVGVDVPLLAAVDEVNERVVRVTEGAEPHPAAAGNGAGDVGAARRAWRELVEAGVDGREGRAG